MDSLLKEATTLELFQVFKSTQSQRPSIYNRFEKGFDSFLESKDLQKYNQLCSSMTIIFNDLSKDINSICECLSTIHKKEVAVSLIKELQALEKQKLIKTTEYQITSTKYLIDNEGEDPMGDFREKTEKIEKELKILIREINEKLEEIQQEFEEELVEDE